MRRLLTLCALAFLFQGVGISQQIPELVAEHGYADMVVTNGKIVSMDDWSITPDTPGNIYQSMAIKGKKIMALGSDVEMRRLAGPNTRFVDVEGHTVIPGLIQTHYHLFGEGIVMIGQHAARSDNLDILDARSLEQFGRRLGSADSARGLHPGILLEVDLDPPAGPQGEGHCGDDKNEIHGVE